MLIGPLLDRREQVIDHGQPIVVPALVPAVVGDATGAQAGMVATDQIALTF